MSTWNCPNCGAVNPAPIHNRPEITCAACAESFSTQYSTKSPATINKILAPQDINNEFLIPKINKTTSKLKFWKLWLKSTAWVFGIGCFIGYISDGSGNALAVAVGSYLIKAPILGYLIARGIKYRSKNHYE
jgi:hypothetical protein